MRRRKDDPQRDEANAFVQEIRPGDEQIVDTLEESILEDIGIEVDKAVAFLVEEFVRDTVLGLRRLRVQANLSQAELAQKLRTTQSGISRSELDTSGGLTLRRLANWMVACGAVPREVVSIPASRALDVSRQVLTHFETSAGNTVPQEQMNRFEWNILDASQTPTYECNVVYGWDAVWRRNVPQGLKYDYPMVTSPTPESGYQLYAQNSWPSVPGALPRQATTDTSDDARPGLVALRGGHTRQGLAASVQSRQQQVG